MKKKKKAGTARRRRPTGRAGSKHGAKRRTPARRSGRDPLLAPIAGADHRAVGGVTVDILPAANGRIKRVVYPPGFRWSTHMKAAVGTGLCMHAHVGFLARGRVRGQYADGCGFAHAAPSVVVVEPGHDAWVVGDEAAVLIQFDAEAGTARQFGLPGEHRHA
jgi:hypothetical protein